MCVCPIQDSFRYTHLPSQVVVELHFWVGIRFRTRVEFRVRYTGVVSFTVRSQDKALETTENEYIV